MARFVPLLVVAVVAAMAMAATAYRPSKPSGFVRVPVDGHVQYLGEFAVMRYNEQKQAYLKLVDVVHAEKLDRGTEHYTYRMIIKVDEGYVVKTYNCEVVQDLGAPGQPPVLNVGYFTPL